ncbi:MAG: ATP-binding protein [Armatimonadota bacterium]
MILSILFGSIISLLLARTLQREREFDLETREFYRRTVTAATNGKLIITDRSEIEKLCGTPLAQWEIRLPTDLPEVRSKVLEIAISEGIEEARAWRFVTAVGEAITNAIKHAGGGRASLHRVSEGLLFVVSDQGPGIPALTLPDVALRRGYSTAGTLGMGYKIMISFGDRICLATGPEGTTVAIEMHLKPEEPAVSDTGWVG